MASRDEKRAKQCEGEGESLEPNRNGIANMMCCTYWDSDAVIEEEDADKSYWIVQNSWGSIWGMDGFIRIAVEEGSGVSNINYYVEHMSVEEV